MGPRGGWALRLVLSAAGVNHVFLSAIHFATLPPSLPAQDVLAFHGCFIQRCGGVGLAVNGSTQGVIESYLDLAVARVRSTAGHAALHLLGEALRTGLRSKTCGSSRSDVRGGSTEPGLPGMPSAQRAMFCGAERNSSHFQAASWFLPCSGMISASPAIVVAQRSFCGSGAASQRSLMSGYSSCITEANQAPAT